MATTFFTSANRDYEPFVLPYAASVLLSNHDAVVEFCLERPREFEQRNADAIAMLHDWFGPRVRFRRGNFHKVLPNSVRFLETPSELTEYTYIGDIDILLLEAVTAPHLAHMAKTGLPYSNMLRPQDETRLTGLHFTRSEAHYPLPVLEDVDVHRLNDERLLCLQVKARGWPMPTADDRYRPAHGIHFSLNRPIKRPGGLDWGVNLPQAQAYLAFRDNPRWRELIPYLDRRYLILLMALETAMEAHFADIELQSRRPPEYTLKALMAN